MDLYFLGTGAGLPSRQRNVTSIALRLLEERGSFWLFDCGEGTQHQIMRSPLKLSKLEMLFVTHLHGDHIYGIPGLLSSRSYHGGETPLMIFGPSGIRRFVQTVLSVSETRLDYELDIREIGEGVVYEDDRFTVEAARLEHRVESFGYRIVERDQAGKLKADELKKRGVPAGPLYGELKRGNDVILPDGTLIRSSDVVGPPIPGRIVTILGDTKVCGASVKLSGQADVLVHEATFDGSLSEMARKYGHCTAVEAASVAKDANAAALIITHISSRYPDEEAEKLLEEARAVFPNTFLAEDFWSFPVAGKASFA